MFLKEWFSSVFKWSTELLFYLFEKGKYKKSHMQEKRVNEYEKWVCNLNKINERIIDLWTDRFIDWMKERSNEWMNKGMNYILN